MDIEKYKIDAENFISKLEKEYYLHFSGQKDIPNFSKIYEEYDFLFTPEKVKFFKELKDNIQDSNEDKKKISYLLKFCSEGYLQKQSRRLYEEIVTDEAKAQISLDGEEIPFRYSEIVLTNELDKSRRDLIDDKRNEIIARKFNKRLEIYWENLHREAKNLGFSRYRDLFSYLMNEDFYWLKKQMDRFLLETQLIYEKHFNDLLKSELGISLKESRRSDFAFLKRAKKYDNFFKKDYMVKIFKESLQEMGIDINEQTGIYFDVEERKNKSPRAFCCSVKVPDEIYLVVMPGGGQDDYGALFHEGGHAEHFTNIKHTLDFEYKYLGDNAVTEGYAFLFEHLLLNENWLIDFVGMSSEDANYFIYFLNLLELWFYRRYAGKLSYELVLHNSLPVNNRGSVYKEILSSANLIQYPPEDYLRDVDEGFYCVNYIKAWIFESQLREYIIRKFGNRWYTKKAAGSFLHELWSYGQKYNLVEILSQLGYKGLDVDYLIYKLVDNIKSYKKF